MVKVEDAQSGNGQLEDENNETKQNVRNMSCKQHVGLFKLKKTRLDKV